MEIIYSDISHNSAANYDGGIVNKAILNISNSIVSNSNSQFDRNCAYMEEINDAGYNIEDANTCGFDAAKSSMINTDPLLGTLQDNGGLTWTHALLRFSPAIDAAGITKCLPINQRGILRPIDGDWDGIAMCDIGSYEYEPPPIQKFYLPMVTKMD